MGENPIFITLYKANKRKIPNIIEGTTTVAIIVFWNSLEIKYLGNLVGTKSMLPIIVAIIPAIPKAPNPGTLISNKSKIIPNNNKNIAIILILKPNPNKPNEIKTTPAISLPKPGLANPNTRA